MVIYAGPRSKRPAPVMESGFGSDREDEENNDDSSRHYKRLKSDPSSEKTTVIVIPDDKDTDEEMMTISVRRYKELQNLVTPDFDAVRADFAEFTRKEKILGQILSKHLPVSALVDMARDYLQKRCIPMYVECIRKPFSGGDIRFYWSNFVEVDNPRYFELEQVTVAPQIFNIDCLEMSLQRIVSPVIRISDRATAIIGDGNPYVSVESIHLCEANSQGDLSTSQPLFTMIHKVGRTPRTQGLLPGCGLLRDTNRHQLLATTIKHWQDKEKIIPIVASFVRDDAPTRVTEICKDLVPLVPALERVLEKHTDYKLSFVHDTCAMLLKWAQKGPRSFFEDYLRFNPCDESDGVWRHDIPSILTRLSTEQSVDEEIRQFAKKYGSYRSYLERGPDVDGNSTVIPPGYCGVAHAHELVPVIQITVPSEH